MTWQEVWTASFGTEPSRPASREESVQDALADLIAGTRTEWFRPYEPVAGGRRFAQAVTRLAFGTEPFAPAWFVSEFKLVVPDEWPLRSKYSYRCPDLAFGNDGAVLVVELKTEPGSYSRRQVDDYLDLARNHYADALIDVVLLGPRRPGYAPTLDDRQRYAELDWREIPGVLRDCFPRDSAAESSANFIERDLVTNASPPHFSSVSAPGSSAPEALDRTTNAEVPAIDDMVNAAIRHIRLRAEAPEAYSNGIDVILESDEIAGHVRAALKAELQRSGMDEIVDVWIWRQASSGGSPITSAGSTTGRELRVTTRT